MDFFTVQGKLHPTAPFDFHKSLKFLKISATEKNAQLLSANSLAKAILVKNQVIVFHIKSTGTVERPVLKYLLLSEQPISEEIKLHVLDRVSFFLSLYDNLEYFYRIGRHDNVFNPVIQKLYGYHPVKFLTPFENACWAILAQYTPLPVARRMKNALRQNYGTKIALQQFELYAFPDPLDLVYANIFEVQKLLGDDNKTEYILSLARAFKEVDDDFLRYSPYDEVYDWLLSLKGVGAWSAAFMMLHGLGRTDRVLQSDHRLISSAAKFYGEMVFAGISSIAEQYGEWQGYWAHYLRAAA